MRTSFLIYFNSALIDWLFKKLLTIKCQSLVPNSLLGRLDLIDSVDSNKLHMMGVKIDRRNYIYGDNMSVIHNTQQPDSILKKKLSSICYHAICEFVTMGESLTTHIQTLENPAKPVNQSTLWSELTLFSVVYVCNMKTVRSTPWCPNLLQYGDSQCQYLLAHTSPPPQYRGM